ncbi:MAG: extracellular solute-binding protein [Candidatus Jacksonbacteria bacterium]|nr:extracellular solute-binding protein [Candidatus Jacksonbacteria bacterium]
MSFLSIRIKYINFFLLFVVLIFSGFGCRKRIPIESIEPITLEYWQVWNNSFDIKPLIEKYEKENPTIKIHFRNFRFEEYEKEMLLAFAQDRGPDIFSIPHDWIGLYQNSIAAAPERVEIKRAIMQDPKPGELEPTIREVITETTPIVSARDIRRSYYSFVKDDVLRAGASGTESGGANQVMAVPLSVDTLALYYNVDILEKNEIFDPPQTWQRFQEDVIKIAQVDEDGGIILAGAAFGTARNLIRPTDILAALMLQTGVTMIDYERGFAAFHQSIREKDKYNIGLEALRFYTDFSDPVKKVYTWNDKETHALEAFKQGKAAYMLGYSYNLPEIRASRVNFGVAPIPVPVGALGAATIPNYWVETVSKKSVHQAEAWHFLNFLSRPDNLLVLLETAGKISPIKEHAVKITDPELAVFAAQAPQARVWYFGADAPEQEEALLQMIENVVTGKRSLEDALSVGAQKVTATLR